MNLGAATSYHLKVRKTTFSKRDGLFKSHPNGELCSRSTRTYKKSFEDIKMKPSPNFHYRNSSKIQL